MTVLIIGGAGSGKSAYAENLIKRTAGNRPLLYLATMEPFGAEAAARIQKHRQARAGMGFRTMECYTGLASVCVPDGCSVLLEDLGNLCANELFSPAGSGADAEAAVLAGLARLREQCGQLVVVSNEVFCGGAAYQGDTDRFLRLLAGVHRKLAAVSDCVCEVSCGIPVCYKGAEPVAGI